MKKRKLILALLVAIFLFSSFGQAAGNKTIEVSMNGNKISVTQVPIIMDGQVINTEFPSFVHTNRTLIPVRFVSEHYGATVGWDQKTQTAIIKHGNKEGRFTLDSNIAIINGEKRILDKFAIPKLATFKNEPPRTMVPLAFMTDIFGFDVGWNDEKNAPYINSNKEEGTIKTVTDISVKKDNKDKKVIIKSDNSLEYETLFLQDLGIFILDIKESKLKMNNSKENSGTIDLDKDGDIEKVEYSQFSEEPSIIRVVVHLKNEIKNTISPGDNGKGLIISFDTKVPAENPGEVTQPADNKITSITREMINGKEALVINGGNKDRVKIMKLKNPERVVVDVMDAVLEGSTGYNLDYSFDFIKGVRVSQFIVDGNYKPTDKVVRVVLDVKEDVFDPEIEIDGDKTRIIISPKKSSWENLSYIGEGKYKYITIENLIGSDYSVDYIPENKILMVSIPTENVDLNEGNLLIKDGLIDEVEIVKGRNNTQVLIKLMRSIEYNVLADERMGTLTLFMERGDSVAPSDKLIVIDPGHGGADPGAISISGKREKDFNLTISLQVAKKLQALGYNIVMTRDTDKAVGLYDRANIANGVNADLFVSIHGNSHVNKSIAGVQVLYCPAGQSKVKEGDQHPFAKVMMEELLKGTGAVDKGIVQRPNLVVIRETKMPAVLVEAGFLSNAAEDKLLFTPSYQEKIVNSIVKGIEKYLEMY